MFLRRVLHRLEGLFQHERSAPERLGLLIHDLLDHIPAPVYGYTVFATAAPADAALLMTLNH